MQNATTPYPIDQLTDDEILARIAPSLRDSFCRLPANPVTRLTDAQRDSLFPPENRARVIRELIAMARQHRADLEASDVA